MLDYKVLQKLQDKCNFTVTAMEYKDGVTITVWDRINRPPIGDYFVAEFTEESINDIVPILNGIVQKAGIC